MARFRQIRGVASLVAQLLGLSLAILMLTHAGRYAVGKYGLFTVLLAALAIFVVAEVAIVFAVVRIQGRLGAAAGQNGAASPQLDSSSSREHPQD